jgi:hypothetical protein
MLTSLPCARRDQHEARRRRAAHGNQISTMTPSSPSLRRFVRRVLVDATGEPQPDPAQLASAFDTLHQRLRERLQPVFGSAAVSALFVRAVHVASAEFPWMREALPKTEGQPSVEGIASVEQLDVSTLEEGLAAVLAVKIGLLIAFVGEDVVLPLVQQAWSVVDASPTEGNP